MYKRQTMRNWTLTVDKREDIIMGVQGRYLFPLVLPVLLNILRPIKSSAEAVSYTHLFIYQKRSGRTRKMKMVGALIFLLGGLLIS